MKTPVSVSARLLWFTCVILLTFFGTTILLLDTVFRQLSEDGLAEQLDVQVMTLLAAAEQDEHGVTRISESRLTDPRLATPGSGLYAEIANAEGQTIWRSPSAIGIELGEPPSMGIGERGISRIVTGADGETLVLTVGLAWFDPEFAGDAFQIRVAESLAPHRTEQRQFRRQITAWFTAMTLLLLLALAWLLRWGLSPLRRMAEEIRQVEAAKADQIGDGWPPELAGVARNMNTLVRTERRRRARYRETMENLAHSLKTPLAVIKSEVASPEPDRGLLDSQIGRMEQAVAYQLRRAAATGGGGVGESPADLREIAESLRDSLLKLYRDRAVEIELDMAEPTPCAIDEGDLYELLGNLMENAVKWCESSVRVRARSERGLQLMMIVDDDGPGLPPDTAELIQERGSRLDQDRPQSGQGIGLAVVREIINLHDGQLIFERSPLGGTRVVVRLGQ